MILFIDAALKKLDWFLYWKKKSFLGRNHLILTHESRILYHDQNFSVSMEWIGTLLGTASCDLWTTIMNRSRNKQTKKQTTTTTKKHFYKRRQAFQRTMNRSLGRSRGKTWHGDSWSHRFLFKLILKLQGIP